MTSKIANPLTLIGSSSEIEKLIQQRKKKKKEKEHD